MSTLEIRPFDAAHYLHDPESQLELLRNAAASGNARYLANAIGAVARARGGLSALERSTGIKRQTLNKAFGANGNPTLETILTVLPALGVSLDFTERAPDEQRDPVDA